MYRVDATFVIRVRRTGNSWRITLQDVRTGRRLEFASWEAFVHHVRALPPSGRRA